MIGSITLTGLLFLSWLGGAQMKDDIVFHPVSHASFAITAGKSTILIDPVGDVKGYENIPRPDLILVTDIHGDHCSAETISALKTTSTVIVGPKAVTDKLGFGTVLKNGESKSFGDINVEAIPMYNLTPERQRFHEKGRGNGYIITISGARVYISGDTEDIPEMRNLKNIDYAFVCMNLPYTMTVQQAASAVLEFKPRVVLPYHYRGTGGFSDVEEFRRLVGKDDGIEVRMLKWY